MSTQHTDTTDNPNHETDVAWFRDVFGSMKRQTPWRIVPLAHYDGWQTLAQREIERRAANLVEMLDENMLTAVATGQIDMAELIRSL